MMFAFEGVSCSGKTSVMHALKERHPDWVLVEGYSQAELGILDDWQKSWAVEHRWKKPFYEDNPGVTFLVNRPFSEAVYAHDVEMRHEARRVISTYEDIGHVLYFDAPDRVLKERGSVEPIGIETVRQRYRRVRDILPTTRIDASGKLEDVVDRTEKVIQEAGGGNG